MVEPFQHIELLGCFHEVTVPAYNTETCDTELCIKVETQDPLDIDPIAQDPLASDYTSVQVKEQDDVLETHQFPLLQNQSEPLQSDHSITTVSSTNRYQARKRTAPKKILEEYITSLHTSKLSTAASRRRKYNRKKTALKKKRLEDEILTSLQAKFLSELESLEKCCHHKSRNSCDICKRSAKFNDIGAVNYESSQSYQVKRWRYKCSKCELYVQTPAALTSHMKIHKRRAPYVCSICGKLFFTPAGLRNHNLFHTSSEISQVPQQTGKHHSCFTCEKTFTDVETMKGHCDCLGTDLCIMCVPEDSTKEPSPSNTKEPEEKREKKRDLYKRGKCDGITYLICPLCGAFFRWMSHLTFHMKNHASVSCGSCGKGFKDENSLKMHCARTKCMFIKKSKNSGGLKENSRIHKCGLCNFTSNNRHEIVRHLLIHSSEHNFQCLYCKKSFSQRWSLKRHEVLHTGLRPYQCHMCNATFADGSNCRAHELLHYGNKLPKFKTA